VTHDASEQLGLAVRVRCASHETTIGESDPPLLVFSGVEASVDPTETTDSLSRSN